MTPSPQGHLTFNASNAVLLFRFLTHQIAVWLGFGFALGMSSGREHAGHSDICATVILQIVDFYFDILVLFLSFVNLFNEDHLLRNGFHTVCWEHQGPGCQNLVKELPKVLMTFSWASRWGGLLPFSRQHSTFLHRRMLGSFPVWDFCPFPALKFCSSLVFLSSPCLLVFLIASCHLAETQWGETGTQETFLLLVLNFLLEFLLDDIDF